MDNNELNAFIERYASQYTTGTAVLLTGEWGSGKSYYINNSLCPFLKEHNVKCVVVSLYGIDNLSDLSKQIFMKLRFPALSYKSEAVECASLIGHSIINNALSFKGVNINSSDKQLQKLFDSVNLKNILLVFEDVERSSIDILKLLGFINAIVEYDGAKVLLVANEDELLRINDSYRSEQDFLSSDKSKSQGNPQNTENEYISKYKRIKEKTIGDTIRFKADSVETTRSIISKFSGVWSKTLIDPNEIDNISGIVISSCNSNYRLLKYALQKCNDIFSYVPKHTFDDSFYQVTFEGALIISGRFVSSDVPKWEGTRHISPQLGSAKSPVFRFVYDYLRWGTVIPEDIVAASIEYENYCYFEKNATHENDEDLYVMDNFYTCTEKEVLNALKNIEKKLEKKGFIGIYAYERLGYLVIKSGSVVGVDTDNICSLMIQNAKRMCKKQQLSSDEIISGMYGGDADSKDIKDKYIVFINELTSVIDNSNENTDFSYNPEEINTLYSNARKNKQQFIRHHSFIGQFDVSKTVSMLCDSTSEQIHDFRGLLFVYYRNVTKNEYDDVDREALGKLLDLITEKTKKKNKWDRIQLLQIKYLISNIEEFIEKMT